MGKKSTKENKNIYFQYREDAGLTRAQASEKMEYISESRIEKIEYETVTPQPDDIIAMAKVYKKPGLCNYYCTHECRIGQNYIPEIKISSLSEISLGMLSALNALDKQKEKLIEITQDGIISKEELPDFVKIQDNLNKIALTVEALKLWSSNAIVNGDIDQAELERLQTELKNSKKTSE